MSTSSPRFGTAETKAQLEEGTVFAPRFDDRGLIPVVTTEAATGQLLMHAWMNDEALARTIADGTAWYWSRTRNALWHKGDTSGQIQQVVEMRTDCDQDTIWLRVKVAGDGGCCHVGYQSCFYRVIPAGSDGKTLASPDVKKLPPHKHNG
ncbi:MAG: phosphoribosyl-AMP cyclohydrolase [Rhizobiales bacterium]|nr:phosphoribosyl-AMP cyclohydrolase [Hyphomicrobiales bacterium]